MAGDRRWDLLTASSKAALRWAAAYARAREVASSEVLVDSRDLLVGILLAHPTDSPARQLFEHFDIPLGAVLATGPARTPDASTLLGAARDVPADELPALDTTADSVLEHAVRAMPQESDRLVHLRLLFGAFLEAPASAPVLSVLRDQLRSRGQDAAAVALSYREFLSERRSYAEFLRDRFPPRPSPIELPAYQPDQPRERRPPTDAASDVADLVGIGPEVDAFAYLIASTRLAPPLAIGLFGDWGSGKSYFLRSVQRRVDQLTADQLTAEGAPGFHRSIVQVEFNAWQYVGGDLWASLLEHLFRNLGPAPDDTDDLLAQRQQAIIKELRAGEVSSVEVQRERQRLELDRLKASAEVQRRQHERDVAIAELERRRRDQPFAGWRPSAELRKMIGDAGVTTVATEAHGVLGELAQARAELRRAGPLLAPLRTRGWRYGLALIAVILLTPTLGIVLERLDFSPVTAGMSDVAWLLASLTGYLRLGSGYLRTALDKIEQAQHELDAELATKRAEHDEQVEQADEKLTEVDTALRAAINRQHQVATAAAALEQELAETTPASVLRDFITERLGSDDYRQHLGVPALVRRDLARLSKLVDDGSLRDTTRTGDPGIDRIVLYVDDLDRCPTELVVNVLRAVHLLLAFPLFVVVVAVDSGWLERSLREHYRQQLGPSDTAPSDFIEKIFQVPFWVRPLSPAVRARMIRGLASPSLGAGEGNGSGAEGDGALNVAPADLAAFTQLVADLGATEGTGPLRRAAADLTISGDELNWLEQVAPLLSDTPRSVKRFTNIYLLLKSMGRGKGHQLPTHGQVIVLLAVATGLPTLTEPLFTAIESAATHPLTLTQALPGPPATPATHPEHKRLTTWLTTHPTWQQMDLSPLSPWTDLIRRFTFTHISNPPETGNASGGT
jgi:KAP family P-loop domain